MTLQPNSSAATLADTLMPLRSGLSRDLLLVLGGALFVALCAQVSVPIQPVPMTLQTLGVLLVGMTLGARRGAAALGTYVLAAAAGLPVLAGGKAGLLTAAGTLTPTLGYLLGYVVAAGVVGYLAQRFAADRTPHGTALAMMAGNTVIYLFGLPVLSALLGLHGTALTNAGLTPFLVGDMVKLLLAMALLPLAWKGLKR